ncbi:O-antigen ligase family protein [Candidatus Omnitrophota bacterium]
MLNILLSLIFIRPFISSLSYPYFDTCYSLLLIGVSLVFIKTKNLRQLSFFGQGYLFLFFLAVTSSAFFSFYPLKSMPELPKFISYFFIFLATYSADNREKRRIIFTMILSATALSLYAIYWFYLGSLDLLAYIENQSFSYPFVREVLNRHRAFMPFALPNLLAGHLIMVLPVSVAYLLKKNQGQPLKLNFQNVLLSLPTLLIIFTLLLTRSIGAFLSIFLAFLIFIFLSGRFNKKTFILLSLFLLAVVLIFLLRSSQTALNWETPLFSIQRRLIYWRQAAADISRHPWRGIGLGNFPFIRSQFTHNSYLQIWVESGILGIIGFLGFLCKSLKPSRIRLLSKDKLYIGIIVANLSFLVHNLIDFSFFLPEVGLFWWIILALFLNPSYLTSSR